MAQPFEVDDLFRHRKITELACSEQHQTVACTVRSVDREGDTYTSVLWRYDMASGASAQITHGPGQDGTPCWSPDGRTLGFLSTRGGAGQQLYLLPVAEGGEARQVGQFEGAVQSIVWAPDGQALFVTASIPLPTHRSQAEVTRSLPYKSDGVGFLLHRRIHLFRVDIASGEKKQLTRGAFDIMSFDLSPDGRTLAYSRTAEGRFTHKCELWTQPVAGGAPRCLLTDHPEVMSPKWSPDGRHIAFTANVKEGDSQINLWLVNPQNGRERLVAGDDLEVADAAALAWTSDSKSLVGAFAVNGRHQAAYVDIDTGAVRPVVTGDRQFGAFARNAKHMAFAVENLVDPCELYVSDSQGGNERKLSDLNPWWRDKTPLVAEARRFDVPDGQGGTESIEGWILRARDRTGAAPLLNDVHGGPASYALFDFDSNVFWQVLCSRGWKVLLLNAVGSGSYGREFCSRLSGHWGELDLPQHMAAVRQLQREGVASSVAISGKSYGGYLSAWATGHEDEFTCAVVMAPVGNIETHYGTSDGGYYADPLYIGTAPDFDRQRARDLSPLQHIERSTTPTLFVQGKEDERCPKCQAEEMYVSLLCAGETPAQLVLYPGESHSFLGGGKPSCREHASQCIVDWLEEHQSQQPQPARTANDTPSRTPQAA